MISEKDIWTALPRSGFFRSYIEYAADRTDANIAYHVGCGLSLLTQVAPENMAIRFGGFKVRANLFTLLVGPSSDSRKGSAITLARDIVEDVDPEAFGERPASKEAVVEMLRMRPKMLLCYPEFGAFLAESERGHMMSLKTFLNDCFDCVPIGHALVGEIRARGGKSRGPVRNPRLSLLCASAPHYLERHTEMVDWTDGFFARFLTFNAPRERNLEMPSDDPDARERLVDNFRSMLERTREMATAKVDVSRNYRGFSSDADQVWRQWTAEIEQRKLGLRLGPAVIRAPSFAQKIAMLFALDFGGALGNRTWQITENELLPAIAIVEEHVKSVISLGETLSESADMRDRRAVLNAVKTEPTTLGEVIAGARLLKKRVIVLLDSLSEEGAIETGSDMAAGQVYMRTVSSSSTRGSSVVTSRLASPPDHAGNSRATGPKSSAGPESITGRPSRKVFFND